MSKNYKFHSLIICDDVRIDTDRKEILIGVYSAGISLPVIPFLMPTFVVRVEISVASLNFNSAHLQIKNARHKVLINATMPIKTEGNFRSEFSLPLQFRFSPFVIGETGKHTVLFSLDDTFTKIGTFIVELSSRSASTSSAVASSATSGKPTPTA